MYCDTKSEQTTLSCLLLQYLSYVLLQRTGKVDIKVEVVERIITNLEAQKSHEFDDYPYERFHKFLNDAFQSLMNLSESDVENIINVEDFQNIKRFYLEQPDLVFRLCYAFSVSKLQFPSRFTGLVFTGYGKFQIYPSLYSLQISVAFDGKIKYEIDKRIIIGDKDGEISSSIVPFAQSDVVHTLLGGMHPDFNKIILQVMNETKSPDIANAVSRIDMRDSIQGITKSMRDVMKSHYTDPLLETLKNLDKEDMANMAESFVSLTSLIRRMSPHEETVGGPVDVAVISKGDGFIWIKRKHYFNRQLNEHFFKNYFND